jgi:hypothetical protein
VCHIEKKTNFYEKLMKQELTLGLVRSDTMLETKKTCIIPCQKKLECQSKLRERLYCCVAMVEINTIASGFGHLGPSSRAIQRWRSIVIFKCVLLLNISVDYILFSILYISFFSFIFLPVNGKAFNYLTNKKNIK